MNNKIVIRLLDLLIVGLYSYPELIREWGQLKHRLGEGEELTEEDWLALEAVIEDKRKKLHS